MTTCAFPPGVTQLVLVILGAWYLAKARRNAAESSVRQAAKNLRKQGVPVELALLMLAGRRMP